MEVKLGIRNASRELLVDTDASAEQVRSLLSTALSTPGGVFELADAKGRSVLVPAEHLAYVEIGETAERRVGFAG